MIGASLLALIAIVSSSLDPETYPDYRLRRLQELEQLRPGRSAGGDYTQPEWRHPTGTVALMGVAVALEATILYLVFAVPGRKPVSKRVLKGLAVLLPWGCAVTVLTVRSAPEFEWLHVCWVWLLIASLVLGGLVSVWKQRA